MTGAPAKYGSIFELARSVNAVQQAALHRIYEFAIGHPRCRATPQMRDKYGAWQRGLAVDRRQGPAEQQTVRKPGKFVPPALFMVAHSCAQTALPASPAPSTPPFPTGVAEANRQTVLRVSNRVTLAQCWYNEERTRKPQTFAAAAAEASAFDPTHGGARGCDFCDWQHLTAADTWGR